MDLTEKLIMENSLCSLATTSGDFPHCTLMGYVTDASARVLYLVTRPNTIKYHNIRNNPNVSLLIDNRSVMDEDPFQGVALTLLGRASIVDDEEFAIRVKEQILVQQPYLKALASSREAQIVEVELVSAIMATSPSDTAYSEL